MRRALVSKCQRILHMSSIIIFSCFNYNMISVNCSENYLNRLLLSATLLQYDLPFSIHLFLYHELYRFKGVSRTKNVSENLHILAIFRKKIQIGTSITTTNCDVRNVLHMKLKK